MDLNSWTPQDISRRLGIMVGFFSGAFTSMILMTDAGWNPLVAILTCVPVGLLLGWLTRTLSLRHYHKRNKS
ncbi:hypothetical protein [Deinococcus cellulosilyticus]|uniref:Uncharacterized protein n=1 Tax=Deinococcus cellulosilyticus (strain DSM 18568 / NBRC 106333 / KACC 11606 / 5516J-15) TaxID=1223518 RepID=A0A511MXA0_DEIC1|nr:hypothetical protein [Deinococcus cellulosilyticus]GEM44766.1 hypothetical protein DC3_04010 [Deinococcus cellulosilyticus NBRC 106333 = KACC 11606]